MRDLHDGSMYISFAKHVEKNISPDIHVMSFTLSVDSASLCDFSSQKICPRFLMINELPPVLRMGNLLIAGLWFGKKKEKLDLFLPPIVDHIRDLSLKGFTIKINLDVWHCKAFRIASCADSVARCDIQGIHSHRGDFPCSWCLIEGEEGEFSREFKFQVPPAAPRTPDELLNDAVTALANKEFINGVKYISPLAAAPMFHPVNGFIVDQMHAKDEGCTKAFLKAWLGEDKLTKDATFLTTEINLSKLTKRLGNIKPPREFRKAVRGIDDFAHWTGRELENWGLFLSVPLLIDILPQRYLHHWALYVHGIHLLLSDDLPLDAVDVAESLLENFCSGTEELYGSSMMRFCLHLLEHFSENARRWGPSFALSAYAFEAGNQRAKNEIHAVNFIPNQICRGISENKALVLVRSQYNSANFQAFMGNISPKQHSMKERR